jgi:pimeloyl-ACP methyl ester carboxylesterase
MVPANGVDLCVETFGDRDHPALLLIGGAASAMDWWEDDFCRRLADGGRLVIRYDHRDTGRSTTYPVGHPRYTAADLVGDALGVLDALGIARAHVVGLSMGGGIAQRLAVEDPCRLLSVTLMSTSPGDVEEPAASSDAGGTPSDPVETDWSDRDAAVDRLVADVIACGGKFTADERHLRELAGRIFDRTTDMAASQTNHWLAADTGAPIRERLATITMPALVLHGTVDPFFSMAHAQALAREIPGARLVPLEDVGHEYPPAAVWDVVTAEILRHTS